MTTLTGLVKRLSRLDPTGLKAVEARNMSEISRSMDKLISSVLRHAREWHITDPEAIRRLVEREAEPWGAVAKRIAYTRIASAQMAGRYRADALLKVLGIKVDESSPLRRASARTILERHAALSDSDMDALVAEVRQKLTRSLMDITTEQLSAKESGLRIKEDTKGVRNHAEQIASARTLNPFREQLKDDYKLVGVDMVEWFAQKDGLACKECRGRDGKHYPLDKVPETHLRCRCMLVPYTDSEWFRVSDKQKVSA